MECAATWPDTSLEWSARLATGVSADPLFNNLALRTQTHGCPSRAPLFSSFLVCQVPVTGPVCFIPDTYYDGLLHMHMYRNKQTETQYNTYAMELLVTQAQFYEQIITELVTQSLHVHTSGMTLSMREAADFFSTWILKSVDPNMVFLRCLKYRHLLFLSDKTKRLF